MYIQKLLLAVSSAILFSLSVNSQSVNPNGTLTYIEGEAPLTFEYTTPSQHGKNWIGLYQEAGTSLISQYGEKYTQDSIVWAYAPKKEGRIRLPVDKLRPGKYTAFFHANDGYEWLAQPFTVYFTQETTTGLEFVVDEASFPYARQGTPYSIRVDGLVRGGSKGVEFHIGTALPDWLELSTNGTLAGTPDSSAQDVDITIWAIRYNSIASLRIHIPMRERGEMLVPQLRVMSFNTWFGGSRFHEYHEKQIRFIVNSNADLVGLQEDHTGDRAKQLAESLGWEYWASEQSHSILSRYPIRSTTGNIDKSGGATIALDGEAQMVKFYVAHLNAQPYGPYGFCFDGMAEEAVMQREYNSGRPDEIDNTLAAMKSDLEAADDVPVFLVGDFNAPSHLDWTDDLSDKHCGCGSFQWPTSVKPQEAGLIDSYRAVYPDPDADEGITYSSVTPWNGDYDAPEPQDRIDFVYHKGRSLEVVDSWIMMAGRPHHVLDEWTSDHAAVMTLYNITDPLWDLR
ncbi:hypothetical protein ACJ41O_014150 [Fusarium nematophilum]